MLVTKGFGCFLNFLSRPLNGFVLLHKALLSSGRAGPEILLIQEDGEWDRWVVLNRFLSPQASVPPEGSIRCIATVTSVRCFRCF